MLAGLSLLGGIAAAVGHQQHPHGYTSLPNFTEMNVSVIDARNGRLAAVFSYHAVCHLHMMMQNPTRSMDKLTQEVLDWVPLAGEGLSESEGDIP